MAEAIMRHRWKGKYEAASAGISPLGRVSEGTLIVLNEVGIPADGLYSKGLREVELESFDPIVNLSEYPLEQFIPWRYESRIVNCYVNDPYGQSLEAYRRARDVIERLILDKVPEWLGDVK